jgi:hypothetical protein
MWLAIGMYCASVLAFPQKKLANVKLFQPVWLALLGGSAIGVGVYEKLPLAFFLLGSSLLLVVKNRRKEAMVYTMAALTAFSILTSVNLAQDGNFSAYKGQRFYYLGSYPFEEGVVGNPGRPHAFIEMSSATQALFIKRLREALDALLPNIIYTFFGRHVGIFAYQLLVFLLILLLIAGRLRPFRWDVIIALAGYFVFYWVLLPHNFYGGGTSLGNRYVLQVMPAFLFLMQRPPENRWLMPLVSVLIPLQFLIFHWHAVISPEARIKDDRRRVVHAPMVWMPFEWTLREKVMLGFRSYSDLDGGLRFWHVEPPKIGVGHDSALSIPTQGFNLVLELKGRRMPPNFYVVNCSSSNNKLIVHKGAEKTILSIPPNSLIPFSIDLWKKFSRIGMVYENMWEVDIATRAKIHEAVFLSTYGAEGSLRGRGFHWDMDEQMREFIHSGFYNMERWSGDMTVRWADASNKQRICFYVSPEGARGVAKLSMRLMSLKKPWPLEVALNQETLKPVEVSTAWFTLRLDFPHGTLRPGLNLLSFNIQDSVSPLSIEDFRFLAVAYDWIHLDVESP